MKRLFLSTFIAFLAAQLMAQVTGVVIDSKTRKPLEFVNVYYDGKGYGEQTDEDGQFVIKEDSTWHELTVSTMGYERQVVKLSTFGKNKNLRIRLVPEGSNLKEVTVTTQEVVALTEDVALALEVDDAGMIASVALRRCHDVAF